jgi:hypothetical protein
VTRFGSLETFRALEINGSTDAIAQLGTELEGALPSSWSRDRAQEKDMRDSGTGPEYLVFIRSKDSDHPAASLSLVIDGQTAIVGNIVPRQNGQLSMGQYNYILDEFLTSGVRPIERALNLKVSTTSASRPLTDWLSETAAEKLKVFSDVANKSSGSSHPADYRRWLDFIVQAHKDRCALDGALLRRWLCEAGHWPHEQAEQLAYEYTLGRDVLHRLAESAK